MSQEQKLPRLVLRVQRRRVADLAGMTLHQHRSGGDLRHVDPARTPLNRVLIGSGNPGADVRTMIDTISRQNHLNEVAALRKTRGRKAADARLRKGIEDPWDAKNAAPWNELLISASPEWFRAPGQGPGEFDQGRVDAFAARAQSVLRRRFGAGLVHLALHLDEETPHLHAAVLPITRRRSARRGLQRIVSHRQHEAFREHEAEDDLVRERSYERFQSEVAAEFEDLGLVRGERRAEAERIATVLGNTAPEPIRHRTTAEWRAEQADVLDDMEAQRDWRTAENIRLAKAKARADAEAAQAAQEAATAARRGKRAAEAEKAAQAAQEAAEGRSAVAEGLTAGAAALAAQELAYRPPGDQQSEGLVYGPAASKEPSWRQALAQRVRPAQAQVLALARLINDAVERRVRAAVARLEGRERAVADREAILSDRERRVERDASSIAAAREMTRQPVPPEIDAIRRRRRQEAQR